VLPTFRLFNSCPIQAKKKYNERVGKEEAGRALESNGGIFSEQVVVACLEDRDSFKVKR
jgi:hypothetical protein